jgi:hypothetical protein
MLSIMGLIATLSMNDPQHNNAQHNGLDATLSMNDTELYVMLSAVYLKICCVDYQNAQYAVCRYAWCRFAGCRYAECRGGTCKEFW